MKWKIIITTAVIGVAGVGIVLSQCKQGAPPPSGGTQPQESPEVSLVFSENSSTTASARLSTTTESVLTPAEPTRTKSTAGSWATIPGTASTITYRNPPADTGEPYADPKPTAYCCDTPDHCCDNPEIHAYICNLEIAGCRYCGSHHCPSFYGTDQWGNAGYYPSLCPEYDVRKDESVYCQVCGKPCGDGSKDTCARYNIDIHCPLCGKWVPAWTCHSCEEGTP